MAKLSAIDNALSVLTFHKKRRQQKVDSVAKRIEKSSSDLAYIQEEQELINAVDKVVTEFKRMRDIELGKLPPAAIDLEEAVLGAIMLEGRAGSEGKPPAIEYVVGFLKPEHFFDFRHKEIYKACVWLYENGVPVDMRIVVAQLRSMGMLEQAGGAYYIAELTSKVSSSANLEYHSRIIVEFAGKLNLGILGRELHQRAHDDTEDVFTLLEDAEKKIIEIEYLMHDKPFARFSK
jgi:replicative DNA helicase